MLGNLLRDRYPIQSLLGRKTGRRTFLATDVETRSPVVIKLLLFGPDFTWDDLKLFEREAETLKSLDHLAIPKYLDFFEVNMKSGKGFALVQSYIEARSLQDWVQSGRTFSEAEIKAIATELLTILDYLHTRQPPVIHRDIKPSNVLLGDRSGNSPGQVYLVDFGSVQTAHQGGTITVVGTYGYMPPEQFGGQTASTSDLYALGATLVYLATGQHPDKLLQREMRILFEDRVNLSPPFIDWLKWLTELSMDLRPKSAKQALEALESSSLGESSLTIVPEPPGSKVQVTNTKQVLEILIPPQGFHPVLILLIPFAAVWGRESVRLLINVLGGIGSAWSSSGLFGIIFLICSFSIGFWMLGRGLWLFQDILLILFGVVRLRINQSEISLSHEMFGLVRLPILTAVRSNITKLEITPVCYRKDAEGDNVKVLPQINIWAGTQKFELGGDRLNDRELNWLAQTVSEWLNLPITHHPSLETRKNDADAR